MNRALIKFLYSNYPDFNSTDLSYFAKELFKEVISKDREKLFGFGKIDIAPYIEDFKNEQKGESQTSKNKNTPPSTPMNDGGAQKKRLKKKQSCLTLDLRKRRKLRNLRQG